MHIEDPILEYTGSFRLVRKIAQGGMATVYEAEHLGPAGFAKRVALKVIHPHYAKEKTWLQLFIDEAKLSANLVHGNIVQIYQLGEVEGQFYIAMEYIQGPTLRMVIERQPAIGRAFADYYATGKRDNHLTRATKELMFMAIGIATVVYALSAPATAAYLRYGRAKPLAA